MFVDDLLKNNNNLKLKPPENNGPYVISSFEETVELTAKARDRTTCIYFVMLGEDIENQCLDGLEAMRVCDEIQRAILE